MCHHDLEGGLKLFKDESVRQRRKFFLLSDTLRDEISQARNLIF